MNFKVLGRKSQGGWACSPQEGWRFRVLPRKGGRTRKSRGLRARLGKWIRKVTVSGAINKERYTKGPSQRQKKSRMESS